MTLTMRVKSTSQGWAGSNGINCFYFASPGAMDTSSVALATEALARVQAAFVIWRSLFPTPWSWSSSESLDVLDAATGTLIDTVDGGASGGDVGTSGASFGPVSSGYCLNYLTNGFVNGRRVRGRTFLSPVNNGGDVNGTPTSANLGVVLAGAAKLTTQITTPLSQVVWHRPVAGAGGSLHLVTSANCRDSFSVLRSRR